MIEGHQDIREAYRDDTVAREYVERRFREPLGAFLHARQVASVRRHVVAAKPARVLEIAPGPARVTVDVADALAAPPVLMDASAQMLAQARSRMRSHGRAEPRLVQGDAFNLPFADGFDLVYTFRLIRHFGNEDRRRIYAQIARLLRPGGLLVFDAVNEVVSRPVRERNGDGHQHYDALLTPAQIRDEVEASGFRLVSLEGVQHRFPWMYKMQVLVAPRSRQLASAAMEVIDRLGGEPLEWIVTCQRR